MVSDEEILEAYRLLASGEGIFCEPASAAPYAGMMKLSREGLNLKGKRAVCVITGTGLKDPELATRLVKTQMVEVAPEMDQVEDALALSRR
jgi:threonine synthase